MDNEVTPLLRDLAPFADLGTEPPRQADYSNETIVGLTRNGEDLRLRFATSGSGAIVEERQGGIRRTHASFRALLASESFGDLRRWADTQHSVLRSMLEDGNPLITVAGYLSDGTQKYTVDKIDAHLSTRNASVRRGAHVMLIDGPAGIGKTKFIEQLALRRARNFKQTQLPLILHVQSRGRNLSFIQDLMAFSLQSLRLGVTYDQVPVLARHRLASIAIDGFDELGDPNGYDLAWAQVSELVDQVRGGGTLILAGRETFIGRERLYKDVKTLKRDIDEVETLSLQPPEPHEAKKFLSSHGWSDAELNQYEEFFERGSYALRPFFLTKLAEPELAKEIRHNSSGFHLPLLVESMIRRESLKFGDAVDQVLSEDERTSFVERFLCEVARDMADNQTEAIEDTALVWVMDMAIAGSMPDEIVGLLRNRANVMAFLVRDERPGYRRFSHTQIFNYFLSEVTMTAFSNESVPKYLRRNLLGADFLTAFGAVLASKGSKDPKLCRSLVENANRVRLQYSDLDRGGRNIGALLLAALRLPDLPSGLTLSNLNVDDAVIRGTARPAKVSGASINQLDIRGANLEEVQFEDTAIVTVIANKATRTHKSFPRPITVQFESYLDAAELLPDATRIERLIQSSWQTYEEQVQEFQALPQKFEKHPLVRLLDRVCRSGQHWIRAKGDEFAERFTQDDNWEDLVGLLRRHELIRIDDRRAASGTPSLWYHIRRTSEILARSYTDAQLKAFFDDLRNQVSS